MPYVQFQVRRGTSSDWSGPNPILAEGEIGYDTTVNKIKIGNGTTPWNQLQFTAVGPTGPAGGPSGPPGPSGLPGPTGLTGNPGAGWSGGYVRIKASTDNTRTFLLGSLNTTFQASGQTWSLVSSTNARVVLNRNDASPPPIFGYIAYHVGSSKYQTVNLPFYTSDPSNPSLTLTKTGSTWTVDIFITANKTFPNAGDDSNGYAYYIYL